MLDPWIIEEIRRREEEQRREEASRIELPLERPRWESESPRAPREDREESGRGVIVIDL
jgi:hypothetical protein